MTLQKAKEIPKSTGKDKKIRQEKQEQRLKGKCIEKKKTLVKMITLLQKKVKVVRFARSALNPILIAVLGNNGFRA